MAELVRFSVSLPRELASRFDQETIGRGFASRSEAVRDVMEHFLTEREWSTDETEVIGTVVIVYDHHDAELGRRLTRTQHKRPGSVVCMTHVHLDERWCMEVIVLRGRALDLREIADHLVGARGVRHGKLVCASLTDPEKAPA
ncbi:MAG TPA: nickel-responsive transcriptional regulator NikR [Chthonomonadales bacterium]|nr:nickel-responsive transcriptional regulator NikR [Chthonomonadales bacterium]